MSQTLSMYQASIPVFTRALRNLKHVLQKGEAYAQERGFDANVLLQARLYPDMLPLVRQVQIATDNAKFGAARLTGTESPRFEDNETSFAELYDRLTRVIEYLGTFDEAAFAGSEDREVTVPTRSRGDLKFDGRGYLLGFATPNVYFHVTTAYAILRHNGVPVGKQDFLGGR
ncbi:DUF1993 domain-containing protein [Pseudoxanthomonas sp. SL93]|uniref:DUF1993 domain-containing protein n=1 Tax=Pseudoxanthomonas sp. SL93 TaxID=2995142 RepID=UPI00226E6F8A|nr:DUF1993 domain-containing protein [Pseudoxanthomonas sp. SL93]WAC61945.1 DUF1993 domain-containing protein [Pseudoxanthomonas sp. SL93]